MARVIVTGGTGYVGSKFLRNLLNTNSIELVYLLTRNPALFTGSAKVQSIQGDVRDVNCYEGVLREVEYVVWFAALRKHFAPWEDLYSCNVMPIETATSILRSSRNLKCFIYISSISVLDNKESPSSSISNHINPVPTTPYGRSKLMAERTIGKAEIPHLIVRLPFMYGSSYKLYTHMWFWQVLSNLPMSHKLHFKGRVSLLHTQDLASVLLRLIEAQLCPLTNSTIILTDGHCYSIDVLLKEIRSLLRSSVRLSQGRSLAISDLIQYISQHCLSEELKYWARILYDEHYFTAERSAVPFLLSQRYIPLRDGLAETFGLDNGGSKFL